MANERAGSQSDQQTPPVRTATARAPEFARERLDHSSEGSARPNTPSVAPLPATPQRSGLLAAVVAAGVAAAMATAWLMAAPAAHGDTGLDAAQQAVRQNAFQSRGTLAFPVVPPAERAQAIASMQLPAAQQTALTNDLARPGNTLVYVTLWDDYAEDGDVVMLDSHGFTRTVALTNAPQRFAVPVTAGKVTLHGIQDGGGGITLGAQADGGAVLVPVLQPGQSVDLPVAVP